MRDVRTSGVAIVAIGDELVLGQTVDTNSAFLSAQLARLGIKTRMHLTVSDDLSQVSEALGYASEAAGLVIATGGLGPTDDDLSRDALADVMGVELEEDTAQLAEIEAFFSRHGRPMSPRNRIQAMKPAGSTMISNPRGTAPGIIARVGDSTVYLLPGVPSEMRGMFHDAIVPALENTQTNRAPILTATIHTFGQGESNVAQIMGDAMARNRNPQLGTTVADGVVSVRVRSEFEDVKQGLHELDAAIAMVHERLGPVVFGRDDQSLAHAVLTELRRTRKTVATAESCTGGLLGKLFTDEAGSSECYLGGWITYANTMKASELSVDASAIEQHGAVSAETALAMAHGALERSGADLAVSVTGIAGPGGGSDERPVGTVWLALATKESPGNKARAVKCVFPGERADIRDRAAKTALQLLRFELMGVKWNRISWIVEEGEGVA